jgi:hypothetical protein
VLYRAELIRRIGLAGVERLEGPHPTRKYTVDDLREIRDTYRAKLKRREDLRQEPMQLDEAYWAVVYAEWLSELSHQ